MPNYQLLGFLHVLEGIALITLGSLAIVHLAKWSYFSIPIISGVVVSIYVYTFFSFWGPPPPQFILIQ